MLDYNQIARIKRMQTESLYLIAVDSEGTNVATFKVSGSTANLYNIKVKFNTDILGDFINCNCPDATNHAEDLDVKCKHCCFVLIKVLKQNTNLLDKYRLTQVQLAEIRSIYANLTITQDLTNQKYREIYLEHVLPLPTGDVSGSIQHQIKDPTVECPICYDLVYGEEADKVSACPVCKNVVHTECINKWFISGNKTCVYCRSTWVKKTIKINKINGYINLKDTEFSASDSEIDSDSESDSSDM